MQWETVIGLEVHVQLNTLSKIFSGAATAYGAAPNTQACIIDLGLPGVLPVLNTKVIELAVKFGLAINANINPASVFARKNYFYPDLPKGYQISQYDQPIVSNGILNILLDNGNSRPINITRAHLEEDAGKSLHENFPDVTGIDLNRAGVPLLEIVSAPELSSAIEAVTYLKTLHALVRYLEISDGNMQEGSFRCDANVSVKPIGSKVLGTRVEIKNINSFKFVEQAINYEVSRQIHALENNQTIIQETRMFLPKKQETKTMRDKEEAMDYRYFPDPDLLPVVITTEYIEKIRATLPELAPAKQQRFQIQYSLSATDAIFLTSTRELAAYFETTAKISRNAKLAANWIMVELFANLNKSEINIEQSPIAAEQLGKLITRIIDQTISGKIAKNVFEILWENNLKQIEPKDVDAIIATQGLTQITDLSTIEILVKQVINDNPKQVAEYKSGKDKLFGFFVGQVLKASAGKANPAQVNELVKAALDEV